MPKNEILEELILLFSPNKFLSNSLKVYLTYEFYFLSNTPSFNPQKYNDQTVLYLHSIENYFSYPMIFTKCLFHALDITKHNRITIDNYISGFYTIYYGSLEERVRFIFHLFNINNENYVHIEDVKCILGYIHIYTNKTNIEALYHIIDSFFDSSTKVNEKDFIHRTYSKNSGILFIVLSIFNEYKTFNNDILNYFDESNNERSMSLSPINNKSGVNMFIKRISSKFKNCSPSPQKKEHKINTSVSVCTSSNNVNNGVNNFTSTCCNSSNLFRKYHTNIHSIPEKETFGTDRYRYYPQTPPSQEIIDYVQSNYGVEFCYMWTQSITYVDNVNLTNSITQNNSTIVKESNCSLVVNDSFASLYSDNEEGSLTPSYHNKAKRFKQMQKVFVSTSVWNVEMEKDFCDLEKFEEDVQQTKYNLIEKYVPHNNSHKYNIPKGSNDFILKSGVLGSDGSQNSMSKNSIMMNKSLNLMLTNQTYGNVFIDYCDNNNNNNNNNFTKINYSITGNNNKNILRPNKNLQYTHYSLSTLLLNDNNNNNNNNNSFNIRQNISNDSNNFNYLNTTFSDYMQSSFYEKNELFEEEIILIKRNMTKFKKYNLVLLKNLLIISKKKKEPEFKSYLETTINPSGTPPEIKFFIPLRRLFVSDASYSITYNNIQYHQLSLISTVNFRKRIFAFFFENKTSLVALVNLICSQTNYTSLSKVYSYIKDIGKGSFCQMKLMSHNKTNQLYAVKQIYKAVSTPEEFTTQNWERDIMTFLMHHPNLKNIIHCYEIIETIEHIYIISEYIKSGTLAKYLNKVKVQLPAKIIKDILIQLSSGISELHKYGIIHRDLKMENILVDYNTTDIDKVCIKIIDFGLSQVVTPRSKTKEAYGTLIYCSPEMLLNFSYNNKIDVWSLGVIGYYILYAMMPFNIRGDETNQDISNKIIINDALFPKLFTYAGKMKDDEMNARVVITKAIQKCLDKCVDKRPGINDIIKILMK